jgi:hypothetical protein
LANELLPVGRGIAEVEDLGGLDTDADEAGVDDTSADVFNVDVAALLMPVLTDGARDTE